VRHLVVIFALVGCNSPSDKSLATKVERLEKREASMTAELANLNKRMAKMEKSSMSPPALAQKETWKLSSLSDSDVIRLTKGATVHRVSLVRKDLNRALSNTSYLARAARIVPSVRNGKSDGFRIYAISSGSIYDKVGLKNGDTVHSVNGRPIITPDDALEVYTNVRQAERILLSLTRRGRKLAIDIQFK